MSGIKNFFKKIGEGTKNFFKKGGIADTGLRKVGNTLTKAGGVAQTLAPLATLVAPELAIPLMAGGALARTVGGTANAVRRGARRGGDIVEKTRNITGAIKSGIEAGRPQAQGLGMSFA
jgi:hypothetical protein